MAVPPLGQNCLKAIDFWSVLGGCPLIAQVKRTYLRIWFTCLSAQGSSCGNTKIPFWFLSCGRSHSCQVAVTLCRVILTKRRRCWCCGAVSRHPDKQLHLRECLFRGNNPGAARGVVLRVTLGNPGALRVPLGGPGPCTDFQVSNVDLTGTGWSAASSAPANLTFVGSFSRMKLD